MLRLLAAGLFGLSAMAAVLPTEPTATPAPTFAKLLQNRADNYTSCSINISTRTDSNANSATATVTVPICSCAGDQYPNPSSSVFTGPYNVVTTLALCYDYTTTLAAPVTSLSTSAQPTASGANVEFGDINPASLLSAYILDSCKSGCPQVGSTTGTYYPSPSSNGFTVTANPEPLTVTWSITQAALPTQSASDYFTAFGYMMNGAQSQKDYPVVGQTINPGTGLPINLGQSEVTQYGGPAVIGLERFHNPDNSWGLLDSVTISFGSEIGVSSLECGSLEKDIAAGLGLIPDVGAIFGVFNTVICGALSGGL